MGFRDARLILVAALAFGAGQAHAGCADDAVEIRTGAGTVQRFHVELADSPDEQSKGLMFREQMALSSGMLFAFPAPKHATFWMKNTLIPLDMIFVDQTGRVSRVHENAIPHDETAIDGGEGVAFVLEINGGLARRLGIGEGAQMRHPLIAADAALWRCDAP